MDVIIHLVKPTECTTKNVQPRTNIGVTYGLDDYDVSIELHSWQKKKVTILLDLGLLEPLLSLPPIL